MNSTTDPLHVPEEPITRSKVKKILEAYTLHLQKLASVQVETKTFEPKNLYSINISNQENNGVADIGKWLEDLPFVVELPIKTIYEWLIFFYLYLIAFISDL